MSALADMEAGEALAAAIAAGVAAIPGVNGCAEGRPIVATPPYATIEIGPELDWGHKTGAGRDIRFRLILRDEGETPARLRALTRKADEAIGTATGTIAGWRTVTCVMLRSAVTGSGPRKWTATRDYRVRMLASDAGAGPAT